MKLLIIYLMLCTGFVSFILNSFGEGLVYTNYVDKVLFILSSIYCMYLAYNRRIVLTGLSVFIASYIIIRIIVVSSFALLHDYNLLGYLFPLKNWFILLNFFIIGQSTKLAEETVNKLIIITLLTTTLILFSFEVISPFFAPGLGQSFQLKSRFHFVKYRIIIDELLIVYVYLIITVKMINDKLPLIKYQIGVFLLLLAFLISQAKQILIAVLIVSLFLITKKYKPYLSKRKLIYIIIFLVLSVIVLFGTYLLITHHPQDTYYSLWRRSLLFEYILDKFSNYPLFGYPIPSAAFGGTLPADILYHFYGFNFDVTIFPSDLPFLFILAEEGIVGLLFVTIFLFISYKKNPEKITYLIIVLLSLIGTFRMYYLTPVGSSFTYFMLGFLTRKGQQAAYRTMSLAHNPYGDGTASKRNFSILGTQL